MQIWHKLLLMVLVVGTKMRVTAKEQYATVVELSLVYLVVYCLVCIIYGLNDHIKLTTSIITNQIIRRRVSLSSF